MKNITINNDNYLKDGKDRKQLPNFKSCEFKPIKLRNVDENEPLLFQLPPDPLHVNLLGPAVDALNKMKEFYPAEMEFWFRKHNVHKSKKGSGGKLQGPDIKLLLKEENLNVSE